MSNNDLNERVIAQAQNHVLSHFGLAEPVDYLGGLNKTANYNDDVQNLYNHAAQETVSHLIAEGYIEDPVQKSASEMSPNEIAQKIVDQAYVDALSDNNLATPVEILNKSANWPEECQDLYEASYNETIDMINTEMQKAASQNDPLAQMSQAYVDAIASQLFGANLKKTANEWEINFINSINSSQR